MDGRRFGWTGRWGQSASVSTRSALGPLGGGAVASSPMKGRGRSIGRRGSSSYRPCSGWTGFFLTSSTHRRSSRTTGF